MGMDAPIAGAADHQVSPSCQLPYSHASCLACHPSCIQAGGVDSLACLPSVCDCQPLAVMRYSVKHGLGLWHSQLNMQLVLKHCSGLLNKPLMRQGVTGRAEQYCKPLTKVGAQD